MRLVWFIPMLTALAVACGSSSQPYVPISIADTGGISVGDTATSVADTQISDPEDSASQDTANEDTGSADSGPADSGAADTTTAVDISEDTGPAPLKPCAYEISKGAAPDLCPVGEVCVPNVGACTGWASGVCKPTVASCPPLDQPVCGCDGKTYPNACEAQKVVVTVKSGGKCPEQVAQPCAGNTGKTCSATEVCDIKGCEASDAGVCTTLPAKCPDGGTQECGCDGNTYPNSCFRLKAGVGRKYPGECIADINITTCKVGPAGKPTGCPNGTYCRTFMNNPIACVGDGECVKVPVVCDATQKPVCGCDNQTYTNACELGKAKQNMKQAASCGSNTCTEGANQCPVTKYCAVPIGQCGTQGVCFNKPPATACTGVPDPVCGCDGKPYLNPSCAAVAGVVVKTKGKCGP
ncbi:MAG: hypothetical protein CMH53_05305 [Myxococcales bacterium]|nr:hypothetical protein [Myxococcales bacterium]